MHILIVSQYFWPEGFRINDVVKSLVERGMEVDILTGKPNYPEGKILSGYRAFGCMREVWSGANIFRVPLFPRGEDSVFRLTINYLSFIFFGLIFGPYLLRGRKYDIIFVYGLSPILLSIPGIFISWIKGKRLVIWVQDLWPQSLAATGYVKSLFVLRSLEKVVGWIYRQADLLLVQSRAFEDAVAELAPGKKIVYYPNSVDSSFSKVPNLHFEQLKIEALEAGFPVIFAGNVGAAQAVNCIADTAELLKDIPEIQIVIFGTGSKWNWLKDHIAQKGLGNIHLAGRFPAEAMPGYLQKAGALLVSLTQEPIFALTIPNKIQAYMASGRPIVASLNGEGARLVMESGSGLSVPAEDPVALAKAIIALYQMSPEERQLMGEKGRNYYQTHFDHEILVDQLIDHFEMNRLNKGKLIS